MTVDQNLISKDEVELYDRQIRLWGLEAQNRMRNSKVLVINLDALAGEVVKNIVLAGIGSLSILDSHTVEPQDLGAQFFLEESDIGSNRAEASKIRIQKLNPRVAVNVYTDPLDQMESSWFEQFDIVVASQLEYEEMIKINEATRHASKCFYGAGLHGLYGYVFADLVEHTFKITRDHTTSHTKIGTETDTRSIKDVQIIKQDNGYQETITKVEKYRSLKDVVSNIYDSSTPQFGSQFRARKLLKISPFLPTLLTLWKQKKFESLDSFKTSVVDSCRLLGLPAGLLNDTFLQQCYSSINTELSPVAAVVGGILGQDILNVLSSKEQPIQNLFIFDGNTGEGPIYAL